MFPGVGILEFMLFWVLFGALWIGVPVALFMFARRFLRAYERRASAPSEIAEKDRFTKGPGAQTAQGDR